MKKLVLIIVVIICSLSTIAHANSADERRRREQAITNATAAQAITTISPAVFQKVEKLMKEKGLKKIGVWEATKEGFLIRVQSQDEYHNVIIYWNGNVVYKIYGTLSKYEVKPLWDWEAIK